MNQYESVETKSIIALYIATVLGGKTLRCTRIIFKLNPNLFTYICETYGVPHISQSVMFKKDKRIRMEQKGKWIPYELLTDFEIYYKQVWRCTNTQPIHLLDHVADRGLAGIAGAYHLDHMLSIKYGFINCIPPFIVGHIQNLEMIPWGDNVRKGAKCSITLDSLCCLIHQQTI